MLEQIGAHHAYARGLTGQGVRVGIEDTIVDWTQTNELGDRVKLRAADGALLLYWRPPGPERDRDVAACLLTGECTITDYNSAGDQEAANRAALNHVMRDGWPRFTGTAFFQDTNPDVVDTWFEYWELPYQTRTDPDERTIIVYAAGNQRHSRPDWTGPALPYYVPDSRGHHLAVVATDPLTGRIADYSDRCGPLPPDWSSGVHGPHFCLAAPGTVRVLSPDPASPGNGNVKITAGTSFAAPVVSGGLALLMEQFRSARGNTEIVKRMLDTADRTGIYANEAIYGAGHLDLEAALSPVGFLSVGQTPRPLRVSALRTPVAYGSVSQRAASMELVAFDEQEFPFWVPLFGLVAEGETLQSPIPQFEDPRMPARPAHGLEDLDQRWLTLAEAGSPRRDDEGCRPRRAWRAGRPPTAGATG